MIPRAQVKVHLSSAGDSLTDALETQSLSALAALAQRTRLWIFRELVQREPLGMAAGKIARLVEGPQNTISAHLAVLARADLVTSSRRGRNIVYRANLERVDSLVEYLVANFRQHSGEGNVAERGAVTRSKRASRP